MGIRNAFVQAENGWDGIGKLVDFDAKRALVEYFELPVGPLLHTASRYP